MEFTQRERQNKGMIATVGNKGKAIGLIKDKGEDWDKVWLVAG